MPLPRCQTPILIVAGFLSGLPRYSRLAAERRRFGYRRLHILLRREGFKLNHKMLFRIYREERLTVRRRGGRKRAPGTRANDFAAGSQPALEPRIRL